MAAGEHRRHERADEMNAVGRRVALWIRVREPADLRGGESFVGARSRQARQRRVAAERGGEAGAFGGGGAVQPDRRLVARQQRRDLLRRRQFRIERGERAPRAFAKIHAAMLLRRSRDGADPRDVESSAGHRLEQPIEGRDPQERRRRGVARIVGGQHAVARAVFGKRFVEHQGVLEHDVAAGSVDRDDGRAEALGAGVESEIEVHDLI
jgi:hypothetical protein